ncbi:sigma-54-dependent transcriptional regulator [Dethiosulfatarculus sandiegensis]|uniref:sigma-54-dependent transcriptional regulator n=1 Tax=Dethiosulfatarculus sandiegensis TaxID=1429043 RepID=UPI0005C9A6AF|nr:sigma-54 dependent transcriptional regulator [Dethiosulfatarculus sandiegensis]
MSPVSPNLSGRVLVADDEPHVRRVLEVMLNQAGHEVFLAPGGVKALELFAADIFDLVILDLRMPDMDGLTVLEKIKEQEPEQTVVMITAYASLETGLMAMKQGAFDYITKPFKEEEILVLVEKALERSRMLADNRKLRSEVQGRWDFGHIIGESPAMQKVFSVMRKVADTRATVLIQGESGTGKELAARALHYNSSRRHRPFVAVNCAAIPANLLESEFFGVARGAFTGADRSRQGLMEQAHGSTLFLDEVGELPFEMQAGLLRVLQEGEIRRVGETRFRKVDLRIVAATNRDIKKAVDQGIFREDLYYRLNVVPLILPSLRERKEDIPLLARHFCLKAAKAHGLPPKGLSADAMDALVEAPMKGNVRELENCLELAVLMSEAGEIGLEDLSLRQTGKNSGLIRAVVPEKEEDLKKVLMLVTQSAEVQIIERVLAHTKGNRTRAARRLGISRRALLNKIKAHGLKV